MHRVLGAGGEDAGMCHTISRIPAQPSMIRMMRFRRATFGSGSGAGRTIARMRRPVDQWTVGWSRQA
jgi:hypothetical protein